MMQTIEIETSLGTLVATVNDDPFYRGIGVGLKRGDILAPFALLEVYEDEPASLHLHVWPMKNDVWQVEPVYESHASKEEVDDIFSVEDDNEA